MERSDWEAHTTTTSTDEESAVPTTLLALELEQVKAQLTRRERELDDLAYAVAHDLSAPVRAIAGYVEVLREEPASEQTGDYLARLGRSSIRLEELLAGLVEYARLARAEVHRSRVDVTEMTSDIVSTLAPTPSPITWSVGTSMFVTADRQLLRKALTNIIANAVKFTSHEMNPKISVQAFSVAPNEVILAVSDNGVGLDMEQVNRDGKGFRLFRRFHANSQFPGLGLGLACSRVVLENHGGRLWCESSPDRGATFFLAFPIRH